MGQPKQSSRALASVAPLPNPLHEPIIADMYGYSRDRAHSSPIASAPPPPPTHLSVPATLRAQPLQVAPTHTSAVTPGTTTFQLPSPAQPVTTTYQVLPPAQPLPPLTHLASSRPMALSRGAIDWDFSDARHRCMQSTRGTAFSDVPPAPHRLSGLFTPDSDPSVAFVQVRAAAASLFDKVLDSLERGRIFSIWRSGGGVTSSRVTSSRVAW